MRVRGPIGTPGTAAPNSSQHWPDEEPFDDGQSSWSDDNDWSNDNDEWPDQEEAPSDEAQDWDEGSDDEWVFDDPAADGRHVDNALHVDNSLEDGGVTWDDSDDIQMGASNVRQDYDDEVSLGPEVELAGRRDVRPRPPKRPRPPEARRPRPADGGQPDARSRTDFRQAEDDFVEDAPPPPSGPKGAPQSPQQPRGRFARTQATIEIASDSPSSVSRMAALPKSHRPPPPSRRRQPQPATTSVPSAKQRGKTRNPLVMLAIFALVGAGGWLAYQSLGNEEGESLIEKWSNDLGVSGSGRTASDTPFGSSTSTGDDLATTRSEQNNTTEFLPSTTDANSQSGGPLNLPTGSVATATEGPPLPKFKPRDDVPGVTGGTAASSVRVQQIEVEPPANSSDEAAEGPSFMQKILGDLISN